MFDDLSGLKDSAQSMSIAALFAGSMGVIGYLHRQVKAKEPITLVEGVIRGLGSGGTGLLVMMACTALDMDIKWTGVVVGTLGWMGADAAVLVLMGAVKRAFRIP